MKNGKMKHAAIVGLSAGLLMANEPGLLAEEAHQAINLDYAIAKPKCKAHGGCGGLTAERDLENAKKYQKNGRENGEDNDDEDKDHNDDKEDRMV